MREPMDLEVWLNRPRHTYACWNLTARGNLAFIANQMRHSDYSMLVKIYGRWIDSESPRELGRIWQGMKKLVQIAQILPHENRLA